MPNDFQDLIGIFLSLIRNLLPLIATLALLAFVWGLAKFIFRLQGGEKEIADGKNLMIWGLIALFVMISVWGILRLVYNDIGFGRPFGLPFLPQ